MPEKTASPTAPVSSRFWPRSINGCVQVPNLRENRFGCPTPRPLRKSEQRCAIRNGCRPAPSDVIEAAILKALCTDYNRVGLPPTTTSPLLLGFGGICGNDLLHHGKKPRTVRLAQIGQGFAVSGASRHLHLPQQA